MLKRAVRILYTVLLIYALLVATHLGEFWPFSIYPMFSQAENEWSRSLVIQSPIEEAGAWAEGQKLVRDSLSGDPDDEIDAQIWRPLNREELPGEPFALDQIGLNQNDLANLVAKSDDWSPRRVQSVRHFFGNYTDDRALVIYRVRGKFAPDDSGDIVMEFTPYLKFLPDTSLVNPKLSP